MFIFYLIKPFQPTISSNNNLTECLITPLTSLSDGTFFSSNVCQKSGIYSFVHQVTCTNATGTPSFAKSGLIVNGTDYSNVAIGYSGAVNPVASVSVTRYVEKGQTVTTYSNAWYCNISSDDVTVQPIMLAD